MEFSFFRVVWDEAWLFLPLLGGLTEVRVHYRFVKSPGRENECGMPVGTFLLFRTSRAGLFRRLTCRGHWPPPHSRHSIVWWLPDAVVRVKHRR